MIRMLVVCVVAFALAGTAIAQAPTTQRADPRSHPPARRPVQAAHLRRDDARAEDDARASAGGPARRGERSVQCAPAQPRDGRPGQQFGASTRFKSSIPQKLYELAILVTARHWTSQFEWQAHHRSALQAGLSPAIADAIAQGRRPAAMQKDEEAVYNFASELLNTKQVSDATFAAAKNAFGERGVVDLIAVMGWYSIGVDAAERRSLSGPRRDAAGAQAAQLNSDRSSEVSNRRSVGACSVHAYIPRILRHRRRRG